MPRDSRSHDHWFRHIAIVVRDMAAAHRNLVVQGVELISEYPQTLPAWNEAAAGIEALYFRDPDRHPLELIHFPPDKGKPLWRQPGETLFQGVDHTALVVSDTRASLAFYRDKLGFTVTAEGCNQGIEQAALTDLRAPRVRIITLAGSGPCGIELLEYLSPTDGRPMPADTTPDDHWWAATLIENVGATAGSPACQCDPDGHGVDIR